MNKRGIGIGTMFYGIGNTGHPNPASAFVEVLGDGTAIVLSGAAEIGQGSDTVLAQIAAEELGISIDEVSIVTADTGVTPDSGHTSASRQTYISGNAVRAAARQAMQVLLEAVADELETSVEELVAKGGRIYPSRTPDRWLSIREVAARCRQEGSLAIGSGYFNPQTTKLDPETGQGEPYATYAYATHIAEVEVDTETGQVEISRIVAAHDVGKAINPAGVAGQITGGIAMGIGFALMEEFRLYEGCSKTPSFQTYLIPTFQDIPEILFTVVEEQEGTGPFGAKGVGEPAMIPTAPAIINAIYDAIGVRITELPATPEKILAGLKRLQTET
jgi:CO/xanthine dehydrogenase Mo-binding subunit